MKSWEFILTHSPIGVISDWDHFIVTSANLKECLFVPIFGSYWWLAMPLHNVETMIELVSLWGILCWGLYALAVVPGMVTWLSQLCFGSASYF